MSNISIVTGEWLLEMGFEERNGHYSKRLSDTSTTYIYFHPEVPEFGLTIENDDDDTIYDVEELFVILPHVQYEHQVEKLWKSLTGTELLTPSSKGDQP